jgi:chromate transporter
MSGQPPANQAARLHEVAALFLWLGLTAFGGPAAHIAIYQDEIVKRRKWLDEQQFLDLLAMTNLIPGPNSTEMVIHIGLLRAGWPGMIVAGAGFLLPAAGITALIAAAYTRFGTLPEAGRMMSGVAPVVIVIILQALWGLSGKALKSPAAAGAGLLAFLLSLLQINPLITLLAGGLLALVEQAVKKRKLAAWLPIFLLSGGAAGLAKSPFNLAAMFLAFLKIGAVLYGSGYVLLAFLRAEFVVNLGWLSDQQLLDAVAIGQVTPGPLLSTATFIGYLLAGPWGAAAATLGIFLPSFLFVALSGPLIPRLRRSTAFSHLLDGLNGASWGMMAAVLIQLVLVSLNSLQSALIALAAGILLFRYKMNAAWLVLGGALVGVVSGLF